MVPRGGGEWHHRWYRVAFFDKRRGALPAIPTSARRKRHRTFADRQDLDELLDEASTEPAE
jgi:hypothetical protein